MIDNQTLKEKLKSELKQLRLSEEQEEIMIKEINYLSNLLIDIYVSKSKEGKDDN